MGPANRIPFDLLGAKEFGVDECPLPALPVFTAGRAPAVLQVRRSEEGAPRSPEGRDELAIQAALLVGNLREPGGPHQRERVGEVLVEVREVDAIFGDVDGLLEVLAHLAEHGRRRGSGLAAHVE